jgi:hypothetical protein
LIETETRVRAYFATPFLNFKIFLKVHIKLFFDILTYVNITRMDKTKDLSKDCRNIPFYTSIHRTVRYASSLACSFNQIIWGIKWSSPGLLKLKKLE